MNFRFNQTALFVHIVSTFSTEFYLFTLRKNLYAATGFSFPHTTETAFCEKESKGHLHRCGNVNRPRDVQCLTPVVELGFALQHGILRISFGLPPPPARNMEAYGL